MNKLVENFIVIGTGSLAKNCLNEIQSKNLIVEFYESKFGYFFQPNSISEKEMVRNEILSVLQNINKPTIVFLIVCDFIIPSYIIDNRNLLIVNYHNSLLPLHRGRNAEAWAIYEQNKKTGITWHLVDNDVDTGDILIQKEIVISEDLTALKLLKKQNQLAFEAFNEILPKLLIGDYQVQVNNKLPNSLHFSIDVPNEGFLDFEWPFSKIQAFIKAMDYSFLQTLGIPKVMYNDEIYTWDKALFSTDTMDDRVIYEKENNCLIIIKEKKKLTLNNFNKCSEKREINE